MEAERVHIQGSSMPYPNEGRVFGRETTCAKQQSEQYHSREGAKGFLSWQPPPLMKNLQ